MRGEFVPDLCHGGRRHRRPRASGAGRGARVAGAGASGPLRGSGARHGSQAGSRREFSHRVDRDRRPQPRGIPADAGDFRRVALQCLASRAHPGTRRSGCGIFHRRICSGTGAAGRGVEAHSHCDHGAQCDSGLHASASGTLRHAGAAEFRRGRAVVSKGSHRSHGASHTRRIFRREVQVAWAGGHRIDHGRQSGLAHAQSRGGRELAAMGKR